MNEIPIAFFPPSRTAEQAQSKLYDINRYMSCIYDVIKHGFEGEQVRLLFFVAVSFYWIGLRTGDRF
jgi:hypothetical protein